MRVSVREFLRNFSSLGDKALKNPVIITKNGRDRLVLIGFDEFEMMREFIENASADSGEQLDESKSSAGPGRPSPKRA